MRTVVVKVYTLASVVTLFNSFQLSRISASSEQSLLCDVLWSENYISLVNLVTNHKYRINVLLIILIYGMRLRAVFEMNQERKF